MSFEQDNIREHRAFDGLDTTPLVDGRPYKLDLRFPASITGLFVRETHCTSRGRMEKAGRLNNKKFSQEHADVDCAHMYLQRL